MRHLLALDGACRVQEVESMQEIAMSGGLTKPNRKDKSALGDAEARESGRH